MARRTKEDAEKTRVQILEAALKVFSEKGYSRTTFVDIAKEIGLTKGAVYWHFKTKPELLTALIAYGDEKFYPADEDKPVNSIAELREAIREYTEPYIMNDEAWNFEFFCNFQIEWSTGMMEEVHEKLMELRGDPLRKLEQDLQHLQSIGALDKKADTRKLTRCFCAAWIGAAQLAMYGKYDRQTFVEVLLDSFDMIFGTGTEQQAISN